MTATDHRTHESPDHRQGQGCGYAVVTDEGKPSACTTATGTPPRTDTTTRTELLRL